MISSNRGDGKMKEHPIQVIKYLLQQLVPDTERNGLRETPERVARTLQFLTSGYSKDPKSVLKTFEDGALNYDEMVFEANIPVFSLCEHHLLPFFGVAHVAYIPKGKIVGLSKLGRLVEIYMRRLQVQERMTQEIANAIQSILEPIGVGVVLRCRHLCMEMRGVETVGCITYTSSLKGAMKESASARDEFISFVAMSDKRSANL